MATETELKFRIPPARLPALRRAVATRTAGLQPLAAAYFDTPGEHLARARCALRLRREGSDWVQTLKAEGAGALQRLEHNVPVPGAARPALDVSRHDGTPAGATLRRLLAEAGAAQPLGERYATAVQRTRRMLRSGGATIELALDEGSVQAGARCLALCEIEFELVRGPPQALLALAGRWAARHGLLLDTRSKSELGHTLAAGLPGSPPSAALPLRRAASRPLLLAQALRPVLANASQLAAGPAGPGHVQQLRLALRRLQLLLTHADAGTGPGPSAGAGAGTGTGTGTGGAGLLPALAGLRRQLGQPADAASPEAVGALLRGPAVQQLWLGLLAWGLAA